MLISSAYKNIWVVLLCCFLAVSFSACAPKSKAPREKSAALLIEPASGKAAAAVKIKGANFKPGEEVDIIMTVGDIHHGLGTEKADVVVADKNGAFAVGTGIPVKTPPGVYKIIAEGNKGSKSSADVTVVK